MSNSEEKEISVAFQKRIEELILENGCQKSKIHEKIGISVATLSKATNYGIIPKVSILIKIADYFDVSLDYLLANTDNDNFVKSDSNTNFYERLEELRKKKGIKTNYQLAKLLYLQPQMVHQWIKNNYLPSLNILESIADYFKVTLDYLLGRTD